MQKKAKNKISRQGAIYRVALAGICAALALLLVWLSVIARYGTLAFFSAASIVLMIPLSKKYYVSSIFAYAVSAGLSLLVGDIASVMAYVAYFGPVALFIGICINKNAKWFFGLPIVVAFSVGALALLYYVFHSVVLSFSALENVEFWVFALAGTVILTLIDVVLALAYVKIVPKISGVIRDGESHENKQSNASDFDDGESPFEEADTFIKPIEPKNQGDTEEKEEGEK